jgi:hypothetical protein
VQIKPGPVAYVVGPDGDVLTLANLPPPDTVRWMPRKKARLVAAVCGGLISLNEACTRYSLSAEEFGRWKSLFDEAGLMGLRVTLAPRRRASVRLPAQAQGHRKGQHQAGDAEQDDAGPAIGGQEPAAG